MDRNIIYFIVLIALLLGIYFLYQSQNVREVRDTRVTNQSVERVRDAPVAAPERTEINLFENGGDDAEPSSTEEE